MEDFAKILSAMFIVSLGVGLLVMIIYIAILLAPFLAILGFVFMVYMFLYGKEEKKKQKKKKRRL